ncbi:MAG: Hsp20/alpha crystallin family protein [Polaromonas sp.]|nr:Hsp20/alpha crystallin family protein [Polaromonas sp.]MDP3311252.1 Hsp20/alpha crystallin family protein [Polaromonas sp.]MDP3604975.1 Hsp20/alpha crystallin family protein [Polaromonas sp.]
MNSDTVLTRKNGTNGQSQAARSGGAESTGDPAERNTAVLPPVDIFEDEAGFTVMADLPGVSKERLNVRVDGDSLVIEGAAEAPVGGEMALIYGEVLNPLYRRSFTLSRELDPSRIDAKLDNGVLRLSIPKAEAARPRRIEVTVG